MAAFTVLRHMHALAAARRKEGEQQQGEQGKRQITSSVFHAILTRLLRFYCVEAEGRGADALAGDVAVEEVDGEGYHQQGGDAHNAAASVDEVVPVVHVNKEVDRASHCVDSAVHDGRHDDGAALDAKILDDKAERDAQHYHEEHAPLGMLRVIVPK